MTISTDLRALVEEATVRERVPPLLAALGFAPTLEPVPLEAWSAYGLADAADVRALLVAGRAGTLDALLIEATDEVGADRVAWLARRVRARNPIRLHLYLVAAPDYRHLTLGAFDLDDQFHQLALERGRARPADLEALEEMVPANGESGLELALRHVRALDRSRVTHRFFRDFRARRDAVAEAWSGIPANAGRERAQLALLFLSRLTFLYFLQRRGALAGDERYLPTLFGRWTGGVSSPGPDGSATFYRSRLVPLFFGALNQPPPDREPPARALGALPYLNGGLFEHHPLERRFPELDLPDAEVASCLEDLLERYRFTARESAGAAGHGIDPEMLGRVFEGLMEPDARADTGSFYTPAPVVDRIVREAVATYVTGSGKANEARAVVDGQGGQLPPHRRAEVRGRLERLRILDPACGSGAFLLGALHRLTMALAPLGDGAAGDVRRHVVAHSLHGVDLLDDAALLCSLRLWLALSVDDDRVRPLPNLDRRIRQGDALVDPLDLGALEVGEDGGPSWHPLRDPGVRRALRVVPPTARRYLDSAPRERRTVRARLQRAELRLARRWLVGARRAERARLRRLRARAGDRDLFGDVPDAARKAAAAVKRVESRIRELNAVAGDLEEKGALPFFSFGVHFADVADGFDVVISNPPWVRAHRWPARLRRLCSRYEVCRDPAWAGAAELTGAPSGAGAQVDLSLLFLERGLRLLAPGGVLAILLPAKMFRALYGGAARRMLLRDLELASIEDHSLDHRSIFRADAFAAVLIGRNRPRTGTGDSEPEEASPGGVAIRLVRRGSPPLEFRVRQRDLPLFPDDPASPWLLAPPDVVVALRAMQAAGLPLGRHDGLHVRRGVMTGANEVLVFRTADHKLGGLVEVESEGYARARRDGASRRHAESFRSVVETEAVRPLVRGADIDAFRYETDSHVVWCHDHDARPVHPPRRMAGYLSAHRERLEARAGWRAGLPLGAIFRVSPDTLEHKVAWHDLSDTLRAVALPATVPMDGAARELVPLNTVYFLPVADAATAMLLAGFLNSLPVRTFARALAERAKDARFRFFAWTVSAVPLPLDWAGAPAATGIRRIAESAHAARGIGEDAAAELDRAVAGLYRLDDEHLEAMRRFDRWLRGTR